MSEKHDLTRGDTSPSRRVSLQRSGLGALAALTVSRPARSHPHLGDEMGEGASGKVSFVTANLVARVTDYRYELRNWMEQHRKTIATTDEAAWRTICREVADAGFGAIEVWEAHAAPEALDEARAGAWRQSLQEAGLKPVAYAGRLGRETLEICRWLGIPHVDGSIGDLNPDEATTMCREAGIGFNIENHPEKSAEEILAKIGGGNEWLGVCIDTGWLGTQGVSGPEVIRACGPLVRHTHIKDVAKAGAHETCLLGDGVADVAGCIEALREIGYVGWYSWEDEPEARNPMESAERNRRWVEERIRA